MASPTRHPRLKRGLALLWLLLLSCLAVTWYRSDIRFEEVPQLLQGWLGQFGFYRAALCYVVIYTVRPIILFPASLLTITAGMLFGPWHGVLFTIVGENASANVAFLIARWFGRDWVGQHETGWFRHWDRRLQHNGLLTVLIMRLVYLPFDAVNYACGLTAMQQIDYALGTFIGILPGLVSFVLLGGAATADVENRLLVLGISLGCLLFGLVFARLLRPGLGKQTQN